ncbi:TIGR03086 family protein [Pseudoclavibacter chungangensis]|uniref:TIGR03086 family protein n=1 Tax=Pseudoclavibacter chungangensis TaxID=587635 RepID=A0A7J5BQU3_9MICO|nr:TIGR03086 family metal-binding protein [Pseudoclavibacter chungangensis]KAB1655627.1 TIGR03086 family protein [Pseudoclavibacter chungangensis]NYJ67972.1 uncharacterized protein (TIGR03086 family) [Pseudoclavibacter chungangensis]
MTAGPDAVEPVQEPAFDLGPAASALADLVAGVPDDALDEPTPCEAWSVRRLLAHLDEIGPGFRVVAWGGDIDGPDPGARLHAGWRERIPASLDALAVAYRSPAAWRGRARVGETEQSRASLAVVALDELVVHGWDLATALGRPYAPRNEDVTVCAAFAEAVASPEGTPGLFGPAIEPGPHADAFTRLLAATGRRPAVD